MSRLNLDATKLFLLVALWLAGASGISAQTVGNACVVHDHHCIHHGIGRAVGSAPTAATGITATANWNRNNDLDLHLLAPAGPTYTDQQIAIPTFPLQPGAPFYPNASGQHISPNYYASTSNAGATQLLHSGDDGGGLATRPDQPNCTNPTGVSCESISVTGQVDSGVYSYVMHAFPQSGTSFPLTNYDVQVRATGNLVLVLEQEDRDNLIGTVIGADNQSGRIDVYALNVGNSGHVGGVQLPSIQEALSSPVTFGLLSGVLNTGLPSAYFKNQFRQRYETVAELNRLSALEKERRRQVEIQREKERRRAEELKQKREQEQLQLAGQSLTASQQLSTVTKPKPRKFVNTTNSLGCSGGHLLNDNPNICAIDIGGGDYFFKATPSAGLYDRSVVNLYNVSGAVVDTGQLIGSRFVDGSLSGAETLKSEFTDAVDGVSSELDLALAPNTTATERLEHSARASYRLVLGGLKTVIYTGGSFVGGSLEPEIQKAVDAISPITEAQFERLSPAQQQAVIDNYVKIAKWVAEDPERQALAEAAGFIPLAKLAKLFPEFKVSSPTSKPSGTSNSNKSRSATPVSARFITRADGTTLDRLKISIPGPTNAAEGKIGFLLGRVDDIDGKSADRAKLFKDKLGFDDESLSIALKKHLTENFGSGVLKPSTHTDNVARFTVKGEIVGPNGKVETITSGWSIRSDGSITLNTAF